MVQWRYYSTVPCEIKDLDDALNRKGKDGWELFALVEIKVKTGERQRFVGIMKLAKNNEK